MRLAHLVKQSGTTFSVKHDEMTPLALEEATKVASQENRTVVVDAGGMKIEIAPGTPPKELAKLLAKAREESSFVRASIPVTPFSQPTDKERLQTAMASTPIEAFRRSEAYQSMDKPGRLIALLSKCLAADNQIRWKSLVTFYNQVLVLEVKKETAVVNLPLKKALKIRTSLGQGAVAQLRRSAEYQSLDEGSRTIEIGLALLKEKPELKALNLGNLYSCFTPEVKKETAKVDLPLETALKIRASLGQGVVAQLRRSAEYQSLDEGSRAIEIGLALLKEMPELKALNLGPLYSCFTPEVKKETAKVGLPLETALKIRASLGQGAVAQLRRSAEYQSLDEGSRAIEIGLALLREMPELKALHLAQLYSCFTPEVKKETAQVSLPLETALEIRASLGQGAVAQLRRSAEYQSLDEGSRTIEIGLTLLKEMPELKALHLGQLCSCFTPEVKKETAQVNLPLETALKIRTSLGQGAVAQLRRSTEYPSLDEGSRTIEIGLALLKEMPELKALHLGHLCSCFTPEVKKETAVVDLPLETALKIRASLGQGAVAQLRRSAEYQSLDEGSRTIEIGLTLLKEMPELKALHLGPLYSCFTPEVKKETAVVNLPLETALKIRASLGQGAVAQLRRSAEYQSLDEGSRTIEIGLALLKEKPELKALHLGPLYSCFTPEVKKETAQVNLPLETALKIRASLGQGAVAQLRRSAEYRSLDEGSRTIEIGLTLLKEMPELKALNLGNLYSCFTPEVKKETAYLGLPLERALELKSSGRNLFSEETK